MRTVAVVALLAVVLTASALDLALGVLWVVALLGVLLLRRRIRVAAVLVLLAAAALLVWGGRLGWFAAPAPVSVRERLGSKVGRAALGALARRRPPAIRQLLAARGRLAQLTRDELRLDGSGDRAARRAR